MTPFLDTTRRTSLWYRFPRNGISKNVKNLPRWDVISASSNNGATLFSLGNSAKSALSSTEFVLM